MLAMPGLRSFSVSAAPSADGVSCNAQGVFIGRVPLLEKVDGRWMPRRAAELSDDLTACYRLPVDVTAKSNALSLIAAALNRGDLAMAAIAAVQMQLPDPPGLATGRESPDAVVRRARELAVSGLLKVWEPEEHPRTGTPPNPGWFAPIDGFEEQDIRVAVNPGPNNPWNEFPDAKGGGGGGDPPSWSGSQNPDIPSSTPNYEGAIPNRPFYSRADCRRSLRHSLVAKPRESSRLPLMRYYCKAAPKAQRPTCHQEVSALMVILKPMLKGTRQLLCGKTESTMRRSS